jgi:peptidoglycan DL-endopeptidase CwlO
LVAALTRFRQQITETFRTVLDGPVTPTLDRSGRRRVTAEPGPPGPVAVPLPEVPVSHPLIVRAAVVATSTAAAALAAVAPTGAAPAAPPAPVTSAESVPTVSAPVVEVAAIRPAAVRASALSSALGKLGAPYRWGAAGPRAFDCSGLASWAFRQAGVTLPRTSRAMSRVGTPVAKSQLQPGDLVFFYRPVSHVAIYIGNGQVVHASTSGQPVKITALNRMPFAGARRI